MMHEQPIYRPLQLKLRHLGPLRGEVWEVLATAIEPREVAKGKSIVRHIGNIGYVASGVLKEYNADRRESPAIVNFLSSNDVFIDLPYTTTQYLKAVVPTTVWLLPEAALAHVIQEYPEMQRIYDGLAFAYAEQLAFRTFLLEHRDATERIALFKHRFKPVLPYIRHRDVANYTVISYDHLARLFARIP